MVISSFAVEHPGYQIKTQEGCDVVSKEIEGTKARIYNLKLFFTFMSLGELSYQQPNFQAFKKIETATEHFFDTSFVTL